MKEIKDDINRWWDIPCSWFGRINIVKNGYMTKCNLQFQCYPYQITNGVFHRTRTKMYNSYGNAKDTQQPKQFWERIELEESTFLTSDCTSKLQYGTGTKIEIQTNGAR